MNPSTSTSLKIESRDDLCPQNNNVPQRPIVLIIKSNKPVNFTSEIAWSISISLQRINHFKIFYYKLNILGSALELNIT